MAKGKVTLQMLSEMMASNSGRSKSAAEAFVRTFFAVLKDALQRDNIVKIKGFGTFKLVVVSARESVNVNTGERVSIAGYNKITFTPDKSLKDRINRPFAQFDTMVIDEEDIALIEGKDIAAPAASAVPQPRKQVETPAPVAEVASEREEVKQDHAVEEVAPVEPKEEKIEDSSEPVGGINEEVAENPEEIAPANNLADPMPKPKRRWWLAVAIIFGAMAIISGAYWLGKSHVANISSGEDINAVAVDTMPVPVPTTSVLTPQEQAAMDSIAQLRATAAKYEQVEGGDYLIAGLKTCRKMQSGMTLARYCRRLYGSKEMVPYVLKYNNFENENVPVGKVINFPILVEKQ